MPRAHHLTAFLAAGALLSLSLAMHVVRLDHPDASQSERELTASAIAFAERGFRDGEGRHLPLFVRDAAGNWLAPIPVYAGAAAARWASAPHALRIAPALVATASVLILFVVFQAAFRSTAVAAIGSVLLLFTPAHLAFARTLSHDGIWHLPFVSAWLFALARGLTPDARSPWWRALAIAAIAASIYTQPSAALMISVLAAITAVTLYRNEAFDWRSARLMIAAAVVILFPLLVWLARTPSAYADSFGRWFLHPAHIRNPVDWGRALANWNSLAVFFKTYWDFFSPSHLLVNERAPALVGVFPLAVGILLLIGASALLRRDRERDRAQAVARVALAAFVFLPLGAAAFKEPRVIERALAVAPMGIVVASYGLVALWRGTAGRLAAIGLALAAIAQSVYWYIRFV